MTKINPVTINNGITLVQIIVLVLMFCLGYFGRPIIDPPPLLVCPPDFFHPKGRLPK